MSTNRSFKDYVSSRFYNDFFISIKAYVDEIFPLSIYAQIMLTASTQLRYQM